MRIRMRTELLPLNLVVLALVAAIILSPSSILRIILGLPFLLFFPGYTLIVALFPKKQSLGGIERIALSFGLSIAVVPLIGLILNYTPWGIRLYPILISLTVFILAMSGVAWYRRRSLTESERFKVSFEIGSPFWRGQSVVDRVLSVVLVLAIVGAIGTLGYVIATPKVGERFTEFYILGLQGKAEAYPTNLKLGEKGKVILSIVNHEQEEMNYQVKVIVDGTGERVRIWLEDENKESTPIANNTINIEALANEEKWERNLLFEPLQKGERQKLEFLLFSPKLRESHHIRSQLGSGNFVNIEINEAEGRGKITLDNNSSVPYSYRLEIWQQGAVRSEVSFSVAGGEKLEEEIQYPPGESIFQLYEEGELILKDSGVELSLYLWLDVS